MMNGTRANDIVVHIADIHFWRLVFNPFRLMNKRFFGNLTVLLRRRHEFAIENAEPFADAVAAIGAPEVILTGDFASTATSEEFEMAAHFVRGLRDRRLKIHLLPGNHDVYTFSATRAKRFEQYFGEFIPEGGYPCLTRLSGGTPLLLVPTVCPRHVSARGFISVETIGAVKELLEQCAPPIIMAAHYPLLDRTDGYVSNPFRRLENGEFLREMLGKTGKKILCVGGHVHRFSFTRDPEYPNLEHVTSGAFFRTDRVTNIEGDFTEIRAYDGSFKLVRHVHKQEWITSPVG